MKATDKQLSWIENRIKQLRREDEKVLALIPDIMENGVNKTFIRLAEKLKPIPIGHIGMLIGLLKDDIYYMRAIKLLKQLIK